MNRGTRVLVGSAALLLIAGCVSTTTTSRSSEAEGEGDAGQQYYALGARYYRNGNYELAKERLEYALELNPKMANAHYTLALTYEKLGNIRLATEHYNEAVHVAPNSYDARNAYAVFLCRQRRFDEAIKQFDKALKIPDNNNRHVILTNAGACMVGKPDFVKAEQYFRDALQERSTYGEALLQLAALKHKAGEDLQARAFLQRYLAKNKASSATLYLGIQIEKSLGDDRASTDYMNKLLRDFPDSIEAKLALDAS